MDRLKHRFDKRSSFIRALLLITALFFCGLVTAASGDQAQNGDTKEYVLGSGDMVRVSVYGSADLNIEARVSQEGSINFPLLGKIKIAGLTPVQAEKTIAAGLQSGDYVKTPHVNLVVLQYQSQFVSVLGDVYKPGRFPLDRTSNLSDVLALAGGVTQNGSDIIVLNRKEGGKTVKYEYDIRELFLKGGDSSNNPSVIAGDIVYVPQAPVFYIYGEVQRPGSFKLHRDMTVAQALSTGGGLTPRGTENRIKIKRTDKNGNLKTIDADLGDFLHENDVVIISESWF